MTLALDVEPSVEIEIDGKAVGRSPIKVEVEPGRRLIKLVDRDKGINLARAITVGRTGETSQQIYIGRGYVNVTAPDGATVFIDGRPAGPAPLRELGVYEGSHVVLVKVGEATWKAGVLDQEGRARELRRPDRGAVSRRYALFRCFTIASYERVTLWARMSSSPMSGGVSWSGPLST